MLPPIVLASGSPRRRELLTQLGLTFEVRPADIDETPIGGEGAPAYVERLATEKAATLSVSSGTAVTKSEKLSEGDPRDIARALLPSYGFSSDQFSCLDSLYMSESGWRVDADNPSSSAYGIPQALTELHDMPAGYMTSAEVQIRWGLEYIQGSYGTPCNAWSFKQGHGWY